MLVYSTVSAQITIEQKSMNQTEGNIKGETEKVGMLAGDRIVLKPGFEVLQSSTSKGDFHARIKKKKYME